MGSAIYSTKEIVKKFQSQSDEEKHRQRMIADILSVQLIGKDGDDLIKETLTNIMLNKCECSTDTDLSLFFIKELYFLVNNYLNQESNQICHLQNGTTRVSDNTDDQNHKQNLVTEIEGNTTNAQEIFDFLVARCSDFNTMVVLEKLKCGYEKKKIVKSANIDVSQYNEILKKLRVEIEVYNKQQLIKFDK